MEERPPERRSVEVGTLSPDGSRRWNGQFWVLQRRDAPASGPPAPGTPAPAPVFAAERHGFRWGGVAAAAFLGVLLGHLHFTLPPAGSLEFALSEMLLVNELWFLFTYGTVVVVLSVGRQGIDVLLLRAMVVGLVLGATFVGVTPLVAVPVNRWLLTVVAVALASAVVVGPVLGMLAALANLLWYRSFRSLRPQLGVFDRGFVRRPGTPPPG